MPELDATDVEILQHLMEDARRSYRDIADEVGLSPPSVSNRVERLRDLGIVRRFTVELDRTQFATPDETLLVVKTVPSHAEDVRSRLETVEGVEHVFETLEGRVVAKAVLSPSDIHELFTDALDDEQIEEYRVEAVVDSTWRPQLGIGDFDIECSICGNTITDDGETVEVDSGDTYYVCCSSCASEIVEQYDSLQDAADG